MLMLQVRQLTIASHPLHSFWKARHTYIVLLFFLMFLGYNSVFFFVNKVIPNAITYQESAASTSLVIRYLEIICVRSLMLSIG